MFLASRIVLAPHAAAAPPPDQATALARASFHLSELESRIQAVQAAYRHRVLRGRGR